MSNRLVTVNSVHLRGCLLWNSLHKHIKESKSVVEFKTKMTILEIPEAVV